MDPDATNRGLSELNSVIEGRPIDGEHASGGDEDVLVGSFTSTGATAQVVTCQVDSVCGGEQFLVCGDFDGNRAPAEEDIRRLIHPSGCAEAGVNRATGIQTQELRTGDPLAA